VDRHGGILSCRETGGYVKRVLFFAGFGGAKGI